MKKLLVFLAAAVAASATLPAATINLANVTGDTTLNNGDVATGTLGGNYQVSIADGATVTISNVVINGVNDKAYLWAGITCEGDATIVLEGDNTVVGFYQGFAGIAASTNWDKTLTFRGDGALTASSNGKGPGIGGDIFDTIVINGGDITAIGGEHCPGIGASYACIDIVISNGTIHATGGRCAAGIGNGYMSEGGSVAIYGGEVYATGGKWAPGIGGGYYSSFSTEVVIGAGITRVVATSGEDYDVPIGQGYQSREVGGVEVAGELVDDNGVPTRTIVSKWNGDLAKLTDSVTIEEDMTIFGALGGNYKVSIADGVAVTVSNAVINGANDSDCRWAGITCEGDATIILAGENEVTGFFEDFPGIYVPAGATLTIRGSGALAASSNGYGAGIGGGLQSDCGNIVIEGGVVTAAGGQYAAGIGGADENDCGNITISAGTVEATGGACAAGIGSGWYGSCGVVSFGCGIARVTATAGYECENPIGAGENGECGGVVLHDDLRSTTSPDGCTRTIESRIIDLATVTVDTAIADGLIAIGSHAGTNKISIADGATVTLRGVSINAAGHNYSSTPWAGITGLGDATIILEGENTVKGCNEYWPGIYVPAGSTLTIQGEGALKAVGVGFYGAGIGGGFGKGGKGGDIVIKGGEITAFGGGFGAGIGSAGSNYSMDDTASSCGDITITGGNITAAGGAAAAGIGGGYDGDCGNISITGGSVDATGGSGAAGIGSGSCYANGGYCGYITIGPRIVVVAATAGDGCENPIGADDEDLCDGVSVSPLLSDDHGKPIRIIEGGAPAYNTWAAANGIAGAWNDKDASGIYNVFRYAFDKPTGDFALIGIEFNDAGKAVVVTPPLVNGDGFEFSVVASDALDGTGNAATYPLEADGTTLINETVSGSRFFRLKAQEE